MNDHSDNGRVALREYFSDQIKWLDRYFEKQHVRLAVDKAEFQLNKRLEGMNEFRDALKDQAARLATKDEVIALNSALDKRMQIIERQLSMSAGRNAATAVYWAIGASVLTAVIVMLITKLIK